MRPAYVIKAEELVAVNYLADDHPRPQSVEWINRGTDQVLRPTTTDMLLRTLFQPAASPSVQKLHDSSGLRVIFCSDTERERFATAFRDAIAKERASTEHVVTAIFDDRGKAESAIAALHHEGVSPAAISLLCRASHFGDPESKWPEGHSSMSITGAVAGAGIAGARGVSVCAGGRAFGGGERASRIGDSIGCIGIQYHWCDRWRCSQDAY